MKAPLWILGLFLYATCPVEAVELDERMFISVKTGENHTLSCNVEKFETNTIVWFKQQLGQEFQDVVTNNSNLTARPIDPTVFYLGAALGICVIVICAQAIHNFSGRDRDSVVENKASQNSAAVGLSYAAKSLRMKSGRSGHSVYSEVRYFSVTDLNNH
ncbi:hypothetical protein SRHO_G00125140 [Serrasalmus rhombeus]